MLASNSEISAALKSVSENENNKSCQTECDATAGQDRHIVIKRQLSS
jgi:hypothetical protein